MQAGPGGIREGAPPLAGEYRCIAIDLPGHADSDGPPRPLDDIADALHRLLGALGVERPVVVSHSMAAALAGIYAAAYLVRGVIDVDQPLYVQPFAELVHSLTPALPGDDFDTAFEPFRQSIGLDRLSGPERSRIAARQRIRQDLVVGYWDEALRTTPEQLQARIDGTSRRSRLRFSPSSGISSALKRNSISAAISPRPRSKNGPAAATSFTSWNRIGSPAG